MAIRKPLGVALALGMAFCSGLSAAQDIVHDAEHYVLLAQHKDKWAAQDKTLEQKLTELEKKHGKRPNIIHIMWDDTGVGEIGIPAVQKVRGWETPNMNQLAAEGINFMRMYTEPSCTPSRAAVMTGRHAKRNGMYNVGFPYEYGGLAADVPGQGYVQHHEGSPPVDEREVPRQGPEPRLPTEGYRECAA